MVKKIKRNDEIYAPIDKKLTRLDVDIDQNAAAQWFTKLWIFAYDGYYEAPPSIVPREPGNQITYYFARAKYRHKIRMLERMLSKEDLSVLVGFLIDGKSFKEIGACWGNASRPTQIKRGKEKILSALNAVCAYLDDVAQKKNAKRSPSMISFNQENQGPLT